MHIKTVILLGIFFHLVCVMLLICQQRFLFNVFYVFLFFFIKTRFFNVFYSCGQRFYIYGSKRVCGPVTGDSFTLHTDVTYSFVMTFNIIIYASSEICLDTSKGRYINVRLQ